MDRQTSQIDAQTYQMDTDIPDRHTDITDRHTDIPIAPWNKKKKRIISLKYIILLWYKSKITLPLLLPLPLPLLCLFFSITFSLIPSPSFFPLFSSTLYHDFIPRTPRSRSPLDLLIILLLHPLSCSLNSDLSGYIYWKMMYGVTKWRHDVTYTYQ